MKFPQDLLRFPYWIFFKSVSLYAWINQLDPGIGIVAALIRRPSDPVVQSLKRLALFHIFVLPWFLGLGTGILLTQLGMDVNWLKLTFYLAVAIALSLTFSIQFCIAFLLPFSIAVAIWSSGFISLTLIILFSLMLGLAYGLNSDSARWGLTAGLVYGLFFGFLLGPLGGLLIGAAFLSGYFRVLFYLIEAPLSWVLGTLASRADALKLWQFNPVLWDEWIWFPLPGLDRHLLALERQNGPAARPAILHVQESFRQRWAAERVVKKDSTIAS